MCWRTRRTGTKLKRAPPSGMGLIKSWSNASTRLSPKAPDYRRIDGWTLPNALYSFLALKRQCMRFPGKTMQLKELTSTLLNSRRTGSCDLFLRTCVQWMPKQWQTFPFKPGFPLQCQLKIIVVQHLYHKQLFIPVCITHMCPLGNLLAVIFDIIHLQSLTLPN